MHAVLTSVFSSFHAHALAPLIPQRPLALSTHQAHHPLWSWSRGLEPSLDLLSLCFIPGSLPQSGASRGSS